MPIFRFDRDSKGANDVQKLIDDVLVRLQSSIAAKAAARTQAKSA
jgi:hypothetical protein